MIELDEVCKDIVLSTAKEAIIRGLELGHPPKIDIDYYPRPLKLKLGTFVTLHKHGKLRGCIGHLDASQSLIADVNENAYSAAFKDYRFDAVAPTELDNLNISVSILDRPQIMDFQSKKDLLKKLVPNEDGLIVSKAGHRATFLPQVWEHLKEPDEFLTALISKAGLTSFEADIKVERYSVLEVA